MAKTDAFFNINKNPNVDAAETGTDPATGRYLSKEERKAIFKKRKINAGKVFNRSSGQSGDISSNTGKKGNPILNSLTNVREKVLNISKFLADQAKSKAKAAKERVRKFQLKREEDKKKQEEEGLEADKPIKNKLLNPVEKVGKSAQNILKKLVDAFTLIFAGWLTDRGFKLIEAFGKKDGSFKKILLSMIAPLAAFAGIFATLNFGLLAVPALIAKVVGVLVTVGGAILGFLLSPPGLITLAIAAGIGAAFLGIKKLNQFLRGGKDAEAARDRNKQMLRDAGIKAYKKDGARVMRDGKEVFVKTEDLTEEERAAREAFEIEQQRIKDVTKRRDKDLKGVRGRIEKERESMDNPAWAKIMAVKDLNKRAKLIKEFRKQTDQLVKDEKNRIREEASKVYEDPKLDPNDPNNMKPYEGSIITNPNFDPNARDPNINQTVGGENIEVSVNNIEGGGNQQPLNEGLASNVPLYDSSDSNNIYTAFTQSQIGTTG